MKAALFYLDNKLGIVYSNGTTEYFDNKSMKWKKSPWTYDMLFEYAMFNPQQVEFISFI